MNASLTSGIVFIGVWLVVVFAYCLFRACGGGGRGRDGSSSSDDDDERADESEEAARVRELESRDAEGRELAKGALLLRNRTQPDAKNDSGPVVL